MSDRDTAGTLPPPPERPDCCFGGCAQCVLDDYAEAIAQWQAEVDAIQLASAGPRESTPRQTPSTTRTTAAGTTPSPAPESPS